MGGTLAACRLAGIQLLATGGIGGVHRGYAQLPDVSADLDELAGRAVCVVCSGAKSLLDVPATLEALETLGVPVLGWRASELPLFYARPAAHRSRRGSRRPARPPPSRKRTGHWGVAAQSSWQDLTSAVSTQSGWRS